MIRQIKSAIEKENVIEHGKYSFDCNPTFWNESNFGIK